MIGFAHLYPAAAGAAAIWTAISTIGTAAIAYGFYWSTKNDVVEVSTALIENSQQTSTQNTSSENPDVEEKVAKASTYLVYGGTALVLLIVYKYAKKLLKF